MTPLFFKKQRTMLTALFVLIVSLSCKFLTGAPTETPVPLSPATLPAAESTPETQQPASLNTSGPYVLFSGSSGIWITNPDGSFPTKISDLDIGMQNLRRALSPGGDRLALVTVNDQGMDLVEVRIPGGETKLIAHLLSVTPEELMDAVSRKAIVSYAITGFYDNAVWQPGEGRLLAFVGAINDPTSDLYVYDSQTGEITQLTNGPSQAIDPNWSPDGKYILHFGVSWVPPFGGAIGGANHLDGAWSVRVSDGQVIDLPKPKSIMDDFSGWLDDSHYITYDSDPECYSRNLRSVDVANGQSVPLMPYSFYYDVAQSPENQALLFSTTSGCADSPGEGIFLLPAGQTTPTRLGDTLAYEVSWLTESGVFQAYPVALFSPDGNKRYEPPVPDSSYHPAVSKKEYQAWEVIQNRQGRTMLMVPGGDWRTILDGFVKALIWDPIAGETLLIVQDDGSLYTAASPEFTPRLIGNLGEGINQAIWMP
ncbi:MAG: hypothetical protein K8S20_03265 [Chloroflexi bacterium]|nr:hypothetical protein [Chloroflexota bacterium]